MPKRLHHPKDKELFQYKPGGNFYIRKGGAEYCLETNDFKKAQAAREYHNALVTTYGAASFKATFGVVMPKYLAHMDRLVEKKARRKSYVDTIKRYWNKYLEPYWDRKRLMDFSQVTWDDYCERLQRKHDVSDFTNHRSTMTGLLEWCRGQKLVLAWPSVNNPEHKKRKRKIIPPEHLRLIFQHSPSVDDWRTARVGKIKKTNRPPKPSKTKGRYVPGGLRLFLALYLLEGMRRIENVELTWDRVDLVNRIIKLRDEDVKTGEGREIPMNAIVHALLTERLSVLQELGLDTRFVFPNWRDPKRHMSLNGFKTTWFKVLDEVDLRACGYTWHDFRATFKKAMHKLVGYTDTQKEKMAGSGIDVQKNTYVTMNADDLRGLENAVDVPGLKELVVSTSQGQSGSGGKRGE